jgi:hypothetical protein
MDKPKVNDILNIETGEYIFAEDILGTDKLQQFKLRHEIEVRIQKHGEKLVCGICCQKIKLRAGDKNRFYFAHLKDSEDCPIKTDTKYSKKEWLSIIYHNTKESEKHIKLKNMLYTILQLDKRFSEVKLEKTIKSIKDKTKWKKPDLQCYYNNLKTIFEIQISHTFVSVIVARELFYEENEMPLFWIFDEFKIEPNFIKVFQGDILAHNNCNIMVFDNETYRYSIENGRFFLKIFWLEPYIENKQILKKWNYERVDFNKIQYDPLNKRAFYYDYERNFKILKYIIKKEEIFDIIREDDNYSKRITEFSERINCLIEFNLRKWTEKEDIYNLYDLIRILLSIKERKNYGYDNNNIIWLINLFYNSKKEFYWLVLKYISNTNFELFLSKEKKYSTYIKHNQEYQNSNIINNNKYTEYLYWFFPELKSKTNVT